MSGITKTTDEKQYSDRNDGRPTTRCQSVDSTFSELSGKNDQAPLEVPPGTRSATTTARGWEDIATNTHDSNNEEETAEVDDSNGRVNSD